MNSPFINLIVLRAEYPDQLVFFYEQLGLAFDTERHGSGPRHHACISNGAVFEIYPRAKDGPISLGTRLGFSVPSISEVLSRLGEQVNLVSQPKQTSLGLRCVLSDPEGHKVELLELRDVNASEH